MSPEPKLMNAHELAALGGEELLFMMKRLAAAERTLSVYALAQLGEIQRRKLYKDAGYHTMFAYCVGELGYSEPMTSRRLQAADAARRHPEVLSLIKDGRLTIYSLAMVAKHLSAGNSGMILKRIEGKSVRVVEGLLAELAPRPDTLDVIRSVPRASFPVTAQPSVPESIVAPQETEPAIVSPPTVWVQKVKPLSPNRVWFGFTGSEELRGVIDRCKELLWHKYPAGRLEDVILELGRHYLKLKDPAMLPVRALRAPRAVETRFIPRWVKSKVYRRDGGRCTFTSADGRRCEARHGLEYDHIHPWAKGGRSDDPSNVRLLCRAHNQLAAEREGLA